MVDELGKAHGKAHEEAGGDDGRPAYLATEPASQRRVKEQADWEVEKGVQAYEADT